MINILTLFGTRPEVIKLGPVIEHLGKRISRFRPVQVTSAQHTDLLYPLLNLFGIRIDYDLKVMEADQTPSHIAARVLAGLDPILVRENPALILVQGDTTTAMAGALAGFHRRIPVGHVEAGLRTGNPVSPFPEEMNRRLITRLASFHFAATPHNRRTLLSEGVAEESIFVTGNPVVDALQKMLGSLQMTPQIAALLETTRGSKRIVLTTHRRESFGELMPANFRVLRQFIEADEDLTLIFPVHPNPFVVKSADAVLSGHPRIHLLQPLRYEEFILLLSHAWLIVSDSGGIQEEAPTLGKPLLILRENTERPEAVEAGVAKLVGKDPGRLAELLKQVHSNGVWSESIKDLANPFGRGDSGERIAEIISDLTCRGKIGGYSAEGSNLRRTLLND